MVILFRLPAQNTGDLDLESFVEERFSFQEEDIAYEDLYESLLQVHLNPLDLQQATAEQLRSLYILSPIQIASLLEYRKNFGPFISIYELQAVPRMEPGNHEQNISPFCPTTNTISASEIPGYSTFSRKPEKC